MEPGTIVFKEKRGQLHPLEVLKVARKYAYCTNEERIILKENIFEYGGQVWFSEQEYKDYVAERALKRAFIMDIEAFLWSDPPMEIVRKIKAITDEVYPRPVNDSDSLDPNHVRPAADSI